MPVTDTATSLLLGDADFTQSPPSVTGVTLSQNQSQFAGNHSVLKYPGVVELTFTLDANLLTKPLAARLVGLVSRDGSNEGYCPINLSVNGQAVLEDFTMPGGGYSAYTQYVSLPPAALRIGTNTFSLSVSSHLQTVFWLYDHTLKQSEPSKPAGILPIGQVGDGHRPKRVGRF